MGSICSTFRMEMQRFNNSLSDPVVPSLQAPTPL